MQERYHERRTLAFDEDLEEHRLLNLPLEELEECDLSLMVERMKSIGKDGVFFKYILKQQLSRDDVGEGGDDERGIGFLSMSLKAENTAILKVHVKPNGSSSEILKASASLLDPELPVVVNAVPRNGDANAEVILLISEHLKVGFIQCFLYMSLRQSSPCLSHPDFNSVDTHTVRYRGSTLN